MLKDLAGIIANNCGSKVVFELPDAIEAAGYSKATKARLDGSKIHASASWKHIKLLETKSYVLTERRVQGSAV